MINIFFFDQALTHNANGIITYKNELFDYVENEEHICVHYVLLTKQNIPFNKSIKAGKIVYHLPLLDYNALNLLIKEIAINVDAILHFN